jgi:hypothetical protein
MNEQNTQNIHENVFQQMSIRFSKKCLFIRLWFHEMGDAVSRVFNSIVLVMERES